MNMNTTMTGQMAALEKRAEQLETLAALLLAGAKSQREEAAKLKRHFELTSCASGTGLGRVLWEAPPLVSLLSR